MLVPMMRVRIVQQLDPEFFIVRVLLGVVTRRNLASIPHRCARQPPAPSVFLSGAPAA
jgi:hypothetical protein